MTITHAFESKPRPDGTPVVFAVDEGDNWQRPESALKGEIAMLPYKACGWFYCSVAFPVKTVGSLIFIGPEDAGEDVVFHGLIIRFVINELGLFRHEFTTDPLEADPQWKPDEHKPVPIPVDLAELKRALAKALGEDVGAVRFTSEGGLDGR